MLHTFTKIPNNQEMTSRNSQSILHEEANDTTRLALDKPYVNFDTQYGKYSTSVTRIRVSVYQQLQMWRHNNIKHPSGRTALTVIIWNKTIVMIWSDQYIM